MPLTNPFRRSANHPSLRERAIALRASFRSASPAASPVPNSGDAELLSLVGPWEAAAAAYDRAIQDQIAVTEKAPTLEARPAREPYDEWQRLIPGWRDRTGVDAAELASRDAMDVVNEIEDRIAALPATTMAGLRLKARIAERSDRFEIVWPEGFGEGLVRDILAMGEPEAGTGADAELIRLGHLFEAAREREAVACEACNEALREAHRHMPERPAALMFRASDHPLHLRRHLTHPDDLEGIEVTGDDIAWMKRKPYAREVRRPVRPEDNLPADAHTVVEAYPWPEAQDRADEIVAAWDAWHDERVAIHDRYVTPILDREATEAGEAVEALVERMAAIPACTADGLRLKLRTLAHCRRDILAAELPDLPDPDQILSHSLWRDVQGEQPQAAPISEPVSVDLLASAGVVLSAMTLRDLVSLHGSARLISDVAAAVSCQPRSMTGGNFNGAGRLAEQVNAALTSVVETAEAEIRSRQSSDQFESDFRLAALAETTIHNDDPAQTVVFARELLAHAEAKGAEG